MTKYRVTAWKNPDFRASVEIEAASALDALNKGEARDWNDDEFSDGGDWPGELAFLLAESVGDDGMPDGAEELSRDLDTREALRQAAQMALRALKAWDLFATTPPSVDDLSMGATIPIAEFRRARELSKLAQEAANAAGVATNLEEGGK